MPTATPSDVRELITTELTDNEILDSLNYVQELNQEYNDPSSQSTVQIKNIERWGAILQIRQWKERSVSADSVADSSHEYEGHQIERARNQLATWINRAGGDIAMVGQFTRDSGRRTSTSGRTI